MIRSPATTATLLMGAIAIAPTAETQRPNILFILADDLGYADTGFTGSTEIRTPALDRLARSGAILSSYYVQPMCSPTRAALMTGRYPIHTGVYTVVPPNGSWALPLDERTLAQALRSAGYETSICGKWHLGESQPGLRPTQRGFDHQYGLWFGMIDYFTHERGKSLDWHRDDLPCNDQGYSTHLIAREACARIRAKEPAKPLFLYLPFNAVHGPHQVPESYTAAFPQLKGVRRTYAGMVAAMDEAVGQVIAALDETGQRDNTLIIFSSDNGGPAPGVVTSNLPYRDGKVTIHEGGVRVCAFAAWPGRIPAAQTITEPLHAIDWYPTLVRLAGGSLEQPKPIDGRDIWPVLTTKAPSPHDAILLTSTRGPQSTALRMGPWKLIVGGAGRKATGPDANKPLALYHLEEDPGETRNRAESDPEQVTKLRTRLDQMLTDAVPHPGHGQPDEADGEEIPAPDAARKRTKR